MSDVAPIMVVVMNACVLTCLMAAATLAFGVIMPEPSMKIVLVRIKLPTPMHAPVRTSLLLSLFCSAG